jgi:predicted transcriptional regulator
MAKVAISIPDDLYERADRVAERVGVSRSELYSRALREYLAPVDAAEITRRLDAVHGGAGRELPAGGAERAWLDAGAEELARALEDDEW